MTDSSKGQAQHPLPDCCRLAGPSTAMLQHTTHPHFMFWQSRRCSLRALRGQYDTSAASMVHLLPHPRPRIEAQANPHQPKHGRAHPTCLVCAAEHTTHGGKSHSLLAPSSQGQVWDRRPCQATSAQLRARLGVCSAVQALLAVPQHPSQTHSRSRGRTFYHKRSCCSGATCAYSASAAIAAAGSAGAAAAVAGFSARA